VGVGRNTEITDNRVKEKEGGMLRNTTIQTNSQTEIYIFGVRWRWARNLLHDMG